MVNLLDLEEIVLGGPYWAAVADLFLPAIRARIAGSPAKVSHYGARVSESAFGDNVAAIGAASQVLDWSVTTDPAALLIGR